MATARATTGDVPRLVLGLLRTVRKLERIYGDRRKFTLDGHLVGSLGEVWAEQEYGLTLFKQSRRGHDARARGGKLVQIKLTAGRQVGLRSEPEHLLVLRLTEAGAIEEVYNGPGSAAWEKVGPTQSNGQSYVSLSTLQALPERHLGAIRRVRPIPAARTGLAPHALKRRAK